MSTSDRQRARDGRLGHRVERRFGRDRLQRNWRGYACDVDRVRQEIGQKYYVNITHTNLMTSIGL